MQISAEEWYGLLETVHKLEDRYAGLLGAFICVVLVYICAMLLEWAIKYDKRNKKKKDEHNEH